MHFRSTLLTLALAGSSLVAASSHSPSSFQRHTKRNANASPDVVASGIGQALAQFAGAALIPSYIQQDWLQPAAVLHVQYNGQDAALGSSQAINALQSRPTYLLDYSSSSAEASKVFTPEATFTLMFIDASYNGDNSGNGNVTRHYLANGYSFNNQTGALENGRPITKYAAPLPKAGDGPHRYMQLVWSEPAGFEAPATPAQGSGVESWDLSSYVQQSKLGKIVALSYIQVQNGEGSKAQPTQSADAGLVAQASGSIAAYLNAGAQPTGNAGGAGSSSGTGSSGSTTGGKSAAAPGLDAAKSAGLMGAVAFAGAWLVL